MDAINKTPAGPGAICESECLSLDEHVRAAWSSAGIDADAGFAVALSVLPALPKKRASLEKANAAIDIKTETVSKTNTEAKTAAGTEVKAEAPALKTEVKAVPKETVKIEAKIAPQPAVKAETTSTSDEEFEIAPSPALSAIRKKERRPDDSAAAAIAPQSAPIPAAMPDLAWLPRHGAAADSKPQPFVSTPIASAETVEAAPRREPAPIPAALAPNTVAPTGAKFMPATMGDLPRAANSARRPASVASQNTAPANTTNTGPNPALNTLPQVSPPKPAEKSAQVTKPAEELTPATRADAAAGREHAASASDKAAPEKAHRADTTPAMPGSSASKAAMTQLSAQEDMPADIPETQETARLPVPAAASHEKKRAARTADPSQQSAIPALPLPAGSVPAGDESPQPRSAKQQARGASAAHANAAQAADAVKSDSAAGANASLTYRFDKWGGNHAVTVQTSAPADVPGAAAGQMPAHASNLPNAAQYALLPSDQLVSQRLQEHLAQFGRDANQPSVHLRDTDEREHKQRQQHQQPQEDDEEEA